MLSANSEELHVTMSSSDREALLSAWIKPSSDSEKDQQDRAERMVKDAIKSWSVFDSVNYEVYTKGSYPNNTNVRADSDVDVVVECHECSWHEFEPGVVEAPGVAPGPYDGPWTPAKWRKEVGSALVDAFGDDAVDRDGKIAINVSAVKGSRPSADVVPSFLYHRYLDSYRRRSIEGSCVWDTSGKQIVNWPQQQLTNGRKKNTDTGCRYKDFVRALKRAENVLAAAGKIEELPAYFMECLVWNVANATLRSGSLDGGFKATLMELYGGLDGGGAGEWKEPNGLKWLFKGQQKWTTEDGKNLVVATWKFLDY
jgi:hypothetical protein